MAATEGRQHVNYRTSVEQFSASVDLGVEILRGVEDLMAQLTKIPNASTIELHDSHGQAVVLDRKDLKKLSRMGIESYEKTKRFFQANYRKPSNRTGSAGGGNREQLLYIDDAVAGFLANANFGPYTADIRAAIAPALERRVIVKKVFDELFTAHIYADAVPNQKGPKVEGKKNLSSYRASETLIQYFNSTAFPVLKYKQPTEPKGSIEHVRRQGESLTSLQSSNMFGSPINGHPIDAEAIPLLIYNSWITNHSFTAQGANKAKQSGAIPYVGDVEAYQGMVRQDGLVDLDKILAALADPENIAVARQAENDVFRGQDGQEESGLVYLSKADLRGDKYVSDFAKRKKDKANKAANKAAGIEY